MTQMSFPLNSLFSSTLPPSHPNHHHYHPTTTTTHRRPNHHHPNDHRAPNLPSSTITASKTMTLFSKPHVIKIITLNNFCAQF